MRVRVCYFAAAAEAAGRREEWRELPAGSSLKGLLAGLLQAHPGLARLEGALALAVNQLYAEGDCTLHDGDEVAVLPPVSGGAEGPPQAPGAPETVPARREPEVGCCRLCDGPIELKPLLRAVGDPDCGAILLFLGTVRRTTGTRQTVSLDYEAYPGMAERMMRQIVADVSRRWPGARLVLAHRTGHLEVGEVAVAIAVAAPHREEAYADSRHAIEEVKRIVPIWKRENGPDGLSFWVGHA